MDRGYRPRSSEPGYGPPRDKDSYVPGGRPRSPPRHRGRSPSGGRPVIDSYRGPSRRYEAPVDSYPPRARSPRREHYDDRGPVPRDRSPGLKRGARDISPRGMRSTPPLKRERVGSPSREYARARSPPPRASYRPRSRSPRREERLDPYAAAPSWRRRSPEGRSGGGSGVSSRRSSPRPHPRAAEAYPPESYRSGPGSYPSPRPRSPPRRDLPPPRPRSPYREEEPYAARSRPPPEHEYASNGHYAAPEPVPAGEYRERPPPTGPSASYREPQMSPSAGPPSAPVSMSAHNRASSAYPSPPARGGHPAYRGRGGPPPSRDYPVRDFGGPPPRRGSAYGSSAHGRGGPPPRDYGSSYDSRGPPRRDSFGAPAFGRGGGSSTSLTTPRTQRFNTHLSDLPKLKEGGEKLPNPYETSKADKLEEEAAKLRMKIDEKEMKKRQGLREWENLERESSTAALKSDLAEDHLRSLNGEDTASAAAF